MNFTNKVIWITGASSGIGKALAIELSKQQTKLIISSRNEVELKKVKDFPVNKIDIIKLYEIILLVILLFDNLL